MLSDVHEKIRIARRDSGWSHRTLASAFGVSLRQVQKAIDPEGRKRRDHETYLRQKVAGYYRTGGRYQR